MRKLKTSLSYFLISILGFLVFIFNGKLLNSKRYLSINTQEFKETPFEIYEEIIDFENFDNFNGTKEPIIPNIVHYLFLNNPNIRFYHLINILAVYLNHKPDFIYFHCDNCSFTGKYFEVLKNYKELWDIVKIYRIPFQKTIFGVKYA